MEGLHKLVMSLRAKRGNPKNVDKSEAYGSPRRFAPRDDGVLQSFPIGTVNIFERSA